MYTVVGLGNPGSEYAHNRHNMGRLILESLVQEGGGALSGSRMHKGTTGVLLCGLHTMRILLPDTFMNSSGASVKTMVKTSKDVENLVVVYDDIDLPYGMIRVSYDRSSGGHNGVESIIKTLKTQAFVRIRVGVAPTTPSGVVKKPPTHKKVTDFLMSDISVREKKMLPELMARVKDILSMLETKGREATMTTYNSTKT
jgi:peptidyl-tRNA hydrolase, PTH1 family